MLLLILFVLTAVACFFGAAVALTCYDGSGKSLQGGEWTGWDNASANVCTSGAVSWCCSIDDYCFSNGLCVSGHANTELLQQGCTSQDWSAPCVKYCDGGGYNLLFPCPNTIQDHGPPQYCCGPDPTDCCSKKNYLKIEPGTLTLRPFQISTLIASLSPKPTTSSQPSNSPTLTTSSRPSNSPTPTTSSRESNNPTTTMSPQLSNGSGAKTLALGLEVGIPLGLAFLISLVLLYYVQRKYKRQSQENASHNSERRSESPTTSSTAPDAASA